MSRIKIIFDTDPGIDDAMALLFALSAPAIELVGITTVLGNATIETTTRNALFLKQRFKIAAPVIRGAGTPLMGAAKAPPTWVHGENGLGDIPLPDKLDVAPLDTTAHQFIIDTVRANPGEITIVAIGRLTNLALALRADPEIASLVGQVVIMGGAFGHNGHGGNVTPAAEANILGDPLAADEVFAAAWPMVVVGLDVTQQARMSNEYLRELARDGGEIGQFIWDISRFYEDFHRKTGVEGLFTHDPSAIAYLLQPSLFTIRTGPIRVVTDGIAVGQTIQRPDSRHFAPGHWDDRPSHAVCVDLDIDGLLALYRQTIIARR